MIKTEHIKHIKKKFKPNELVRDIIIGMSDGLTVPFALAAGLSSAGAHSSIVVVAGVAEIVAGSISMGLGGYLAAQNDAEYYYNKRKDEYREVAEVPHEEREEVAEVFRSYGLPEADILPILDHFEKHPDHWVDFMMRAELKLDEPDPTRSFYSGLTIGLSYIVGGAVPLSPYIFISSVHEAFLVSVGVTLAALVAFGYIKAHFIGSNPWKGAFRTVIIGGIAAGAAYFLARLIS